MPADSWDLMMMVMMMVVTNVIDVILIINHHSHHRRAKHIICINHCHRKASICLIGGAVFVIDKTTLV